MSAVAATVATAARARTDLRNIGVFSCFYWMCSHILDHQSGESSIGFKAGSRKATPVRPATGRVIASSAVLPRFRPAAISPRDPGFPVSLPRKEAIHAARAYLLDHQTRRHRP